MDLSNEEIDKKARELRKKYNKDYYLKNKTKIQKNQREYWRKKAREVISSSGE